MTSPMMSLVPARPDADIAKELKAEILAKLEEVCLISDKATAAGFDVQFGLSKREWDGKWSIGQLKLVKYF